jgi:predicted GNAT family acetyltransferase
VLRERPRYPSAPGHARLVTPADGALFADWTIAFLREAVPHDPQPSRERLAQSAGDGRYQFWVVDGEPVSMAGIIRRTRHAAAIAGVYTPPALRGHGYAGSVTAAVVERIFAEGKIAACLYTDLRNPYSNRCYARIGFTPVCPTWHYLRAVPPTQVSSDPTASAPPG